MDKRKEIIRNALREGKCEDWTKGKRKQHHEDGTGERR